MTVFLMGDPGFIIFNLSWCLKLYGTFWQSKLSCKINCEKVKRLDFLTFILNFNLSKIPWI